MFNYEKQKKKTQQDAREDKNSFGRRGERQSRVEFRPRISPQLIPILKKIGVPEKTPFVPDPFQVEALAKLKVSDVIVSAPTGSGKTYIAVEAMAEVLAKGGRVWYASPLKALSNSKFIEFSDRFGPEKVGLLTGDHKFNLDAPLIVGTTEILRNQLYDAMSQGANLSADMVVMDEAHYLGDPDRGVVWEEVLIYISPRVRLLLLSATASNARELAEWLTRIRGQKAEAVIAHQRPVPLHPLFLFPEGELVSLTKGRTLNPQVRQYVERNPPGRRQGGQVQTPFGRILGVLEEADLLPAIFFLKSRSDCDLALQRCYHSAGYQDPESRRRLEERVEELLERYPLLKSHHHLKYLLGPGVAAHHAGHMPHWKLVVEHLMQEGLLKAIFSTSTVAAGVNFPARTVVICQSDRFNGREFTDLTATELLQMTGRAGRRGMDQIGFALVVPGPFQNPELVHALFKAPPDPVVSQIQVNFSMILNLLLSYQPDQIKTLLELSLASFQQGRSTAGDESVHFFEELGQLTVKGSCGSAEEALSLAERNQSLQREERGLRRLRPRLAREGALRAGMTPGRLFEASSGLVYCLISALEKRGREGVMAAKVKEDLGLRKGAVRQKWIPLSRVTRLLNFKLDIGPEKKPREIIDLIRAAAEREYETLDPASLAAEDPRVADLDSRLARIGSDLAASPCQDCPILWECQSDRDGEIPYVMEMIRDLEERSRSAGRVLWSNFVRRLEVLKSEGFVTAEGELTEDGRWASRLRLDHPLIFAEGIRAKAWPEDDPALLAALVAPYVVDKDREGDAEPQSLKAWPGLADAWLKLEDATSPIIQRLRLSGFETPILKLRPALAIYAWATLGLWDEAVRLYGLDPGDMAMLVFRTADNLRQMAGLAEFQPRLAPTAKAAVDLIMKEPVITPL
ncbi:MAG: DEAD/DEAH box helicase [Pseudomonadota bacterium]